MSKISVYLPDDLAARLQQRPRINVSALVQEALEQRLRSGDPDRTSEDDARDLVAVMLRDVAPSYYVTAVQTIRCRGYPDRACPQLEIVLENGQHFVLMVFEA